MRIDELKVDSRPKELGDAYFFHDGTMYDIAPERNHRDWLVNHADELDLPDYIQEKPSKALFESYKRGWIRIVWDEGGKWKQGKASKEGNVLYLNGIDNYVWKSIRPIMNNERWAGLIDTVVIEYLDIVDGKPKWDRTDMFRDKDKIEFLYKGRKPHPDRLPPGRYYEYESMYYNKLMNTLNESDEPINIHKTL